MGSYKKGLLGLCVLVTCLAPGIVTGADAKKSPTGKATVAQVLGRLLPLPDDVSRSIMNPYHTEPAWKLWAVDPSPVTLTRPGKKGTYRVPPAARRYPVMVRKGSAKLSLEPLGKTKIAGFWDDCYMSLDSHHTRLGAFKGQFIDAGAMRTARDVQVILQLGVNFTSQSYADRGRHIVDDVYNNLNTERHFFFANCIRATPAHASYEDKAEGGVKDLYDGLFAHSFHSLGQSGSEVHAIYKMMAAGACMPRTTKDLLKKHGAYAIALLTIFKAALPYADARGEALPFEHELRHRPAYSSHGTPSHPHYCPANAHYHGYDELRHLQGMLDMAGALDHAPPVAVAKVKSFFVEKGGKPLMDKSLVAERIKSLALTNMRFWGQEGETLVVRINLNSSYDLQNRPLSFKCQALYPNQKNVSIKEETAGVYLIRVTHDSKLPKGRIPVICTADNGLSVPSNPVFINFYWPGDNEAPDYFPKDALSETVRKEIKALGLKHLPVTVNKRPVVNFGFAGDAVRCRPGQTLSIALNGTDPEGHPVTVYRRAGQIGSVEQGRFKVTVPDSTRDRIHRVHFIFSDGTGGYTGKQLKLLVSTQPEALPEDWSVTTVGAVQRAVTVSHGKDTITFGKQPVERYAKPLQGTFVFKPLSGDADLVCRIPEIGKGSDMALMITNTLDGSSRHAGIGVFDGKISGVIRPAERSWGRKETPWKGDGSDRPQFFRLTRRGNEVIGYVSRDNKTWDKVMTGKVGYFKQCYAGVVYKGEPWNTGTCEGLSVATLP